MSHVRLVSDITLLEENKVLLVRYRRPGYDTGWCLPDAMLKDFEHPEEAAKRILNEQSGIHVPCLLAKLLARLRYTVSILISLGAQWVRF